MKLIVFDRTDEGTSFTINDVYPDGLPTNFPDSQSKNRCWILTSGDGNNVLARGGDLSILNTEPK